MSEKPRTQDEVRKERFFKIVKEAKALGELATAEIDEALAANAELIQFPVQPTYPEGDDAA